MGITRFLYFLLFCAILFLLYTKENKEVQVKKTENTLVEFENSVMYDISQEGVKQVIQSQNAYFFENYEHLKNATIIVKSKIDNSKSSTLTAGEVMKVKSDFYLTSNVIYENEDNSTLKTEELKYNLDNKIATNKTAFTLSKENSVFSGENIYLDGTTNYVKAKNTHFKIELKENNETK